MLQIAADVLFAPYLVCVSPSLLRYQREAPGGFEHLPAATRTADRPLSSAPSSDIIDSSGDQPALSLFPDQLLLGDIEGLQVPVLPC